MKSTCSLLFIVITISMLFLIATIREASALSPSFPRQAEVEPAHDWQYVPLSPHSNCTKIQLPVQIPHITGISYFSDGNYLNATIWLSGPFQKWPLPLIGFPTYSMDISIVQSYNTTAKADYADLVQWNGLSSTWTRTIEEFLANGTRTLLFDKNYTNFDNSGKNGHVNFTLDLSKVSSPTQYYLTFLALDAILVNGNACGLIDVIRHPIYIPPPDFRVSVYPNPSEIKQGEEKTLELRVNSTTLVQPLLTISRVNTSDGVSISFIPNTMHIPPEGVATSQVNVNATDSADIGPHSFGINTAISLPAPFNVAQLASQVFRSSKVAGQQNPNISILGVSKASKGLVVIPRPSYFSVIVSSYSFEDRFKDFWNTYGGVIGLIGGGFAAGFSALLVDRLKKRKSK